MSSRISRFIKIFVGISLLVPMLVAADTTRPGSTNNRDLEGNAQVMTAGKMSLLAAFIANLSVPSYKTVHTGDTLYFTWAQPNDVSSITLSAVPVASTYKDVEQGVVNPIFAASVTGSTTSWTVPQLFPGRYSIVLHGNNAANPTKYADKYLYINVTSTAAPTITAKATTVGTSTFPLILKGTNFTPTDTVYVASHGTGCPVNLQTNTAVASSTSVLSTSIDSRFILNNNPVCKYVLWVENNSGQKSNIVALTVKITPQTNVSPVQLTSAIAYYDMNSTGTPIVITLIGTGLDPLANRVDITDSNFGANKKSFLNVTSASGTSIQIADPTIDLTRSLRVTVTNGSNKKSAALPISIGLPPQIVYLQQVSPSANTSITIDPSDQQASVLQSFLDLLNTWLGK